MTMLTRSELDAIRARADAATPGPWCWESVSEKANEWIVGLAEDKNGLALAGEVGAGSIVDDIVRRCIVGESCSELSSFNDPKFISSARTDIPALLSHIAEQERVIAQLREALEDSTEMLNSFRNLEANEEGAVTQQVAENEAALDAAGRK